MDGENGSGVAWRIPGITNTVKEAWGGGMKPCYIRTLFQQLRPRNWMEGGEGM